MLRFKIVIENTFSFKWVLTTLKQIEHQNRG